MDQLYSLDSLLFSAFASFLGGIFLVLISKARIGSIKSKIKDIDFEIDFLDRVSKGNIQLLRSAFGVFSYGFFLAFLALAIIFVSQGLVTLPSWVKSYALFMGGLILISSSIIFLMFGNSIRRLKDLNANKEKLEQKKKKLQEKL